MPTERPNLRAAVIEVHLAEIELSRLERLHPQDDRHEDVLAARRTLHLRRQQLTAAQAITAVSAPDG